MTALPGVAPQQPPQSSKSSNCLAFATAGCAVLIVIGVISVVALLVFVLGIIKRSDAYTGARDRVVSDPRVIARLGAPVAAGWWVRGTVNVKKESGEADFQFPVDGPKGSATVHAVAERAGNRWTYTQLTVTPATVPPIDLMQ